jgi:hypothetical protein
MKSLLIHADQGARSGFVAAWLTDKLYKPAWDCGAELVPKFRKIHTLGDVDSFTYCVGTTNSIINFSGTKIRIQPNIDTIDLHLFLFLKKAGKNLKYGNNDEYSLDTYNRLNAYSKEIFNQDNAIDYSLYDIVLNFADTFDYDYMINLYKKVVGTNPTQEMINVLIETNNINNVTIDKNHACSMVKLCLSQEQKLGLKEEDRSWSIDNIYNITPVNQLYDTVLQSIVPDNYRTK